MAGDQRRRGLLQRVVGEQPAIGVGEFRRRAPAKPHRLRNGGRTVADTPAQVGEVAQQRRLGQGELAGLPQRRPARVGAQKRDVPGVEGEPHVELSGASLR